MVDQAYPGRGGSARGAAVAGGRLDGVGGGYPVAEPVGDGERAGFSGVLQPGVQRAASDRSELRSVHDAGGSRRRLVLVHDRQRGWLLLPLFVVGAHPVVYAVGWLAVTVALGVWAPVGVFFAVGWAGPWLVFFALGHRAGRSAHLDQRGGLGAAGVRRPGRADGLDSGRAGTDEGMTR
ncbi:MAG TPA: hypothetical protein DCM67_00580 [Propionibacteriaceae bacterium]|nr:hypothetical protein [Propionibacteriaceae bacterium]